MGVQLKLVKLIREQRVSDLFLRINSSLVWSKFRRRLARNRNGSLVALNIEGRPFFFLKWKLVLGTNIFFFWNKHFFERTLETVHKNFSLPLFLPWKIELVVILCPLKLFDCNIIKLNEAPHFSCVTSLSFKSVFVYNIIKWN